MSSNKYLTLYRFQRSPVVSGQTGHWRIDTQGIYLTNNPSLVYYMHSIVDKNLHVYKIHPGIKRCNGVKWGLFDGAWEMFIPKAVWDTFPDIEYVGKTKSKKFKSFYIRSSKGREGNITKFVRQVRRFMVG